MQNKMNEVYRKIGARFAEQSSYQSRVSYIISAGGHSMIDRAGYHAFANELYHLVLNYEAGSLPAEVAALVAKWKARGLTELELVNIHSTVFGIPAPGP